jgi:hypothetical protein
MSTAQQLKVAGQQLALFNSGSAWTESVMECCEDFCREHRAAGKVTFLWEQFRWYAQERGFYAHIDKAWGALASKAARRGLIESTGGYAPTISLKTKGHPSIIWRVM